MNYPVNKYKVYIIGDHIIGAWLVNGSDTQQLNLEGEIVPSLHS